MSNLRQSWYEAGARDRIAALVDTGSFAEFVGPDCRETSPHLGIFDLPAQFDDGIVVGSATLDGTPVLIAAQEGRFMGGAFGVAGKPGNVTPVAEANIWNDPEAADLVFTAPWALTAVSLDVTTQVVMSPAYMDALEASAGPAGAFLNAISKPYAAFYGDRDGITGCCVHDAAAVAFVIDPSLFQLRRGSVRVVTDGVALGQTCQKVEGELFGPSAWDDQPIQAVTVAVDGAGLLKLYAETMAGAA